MNKNENPVFAIAAWRNPNATKHPLSIMFAQSFDYSSFLSFKLGRSSRRVVTDNFPAEVAAKFGLNFDDLGEGYDNATKINIDFNELSNLDMRIQALETVDETFAKKEYYQPKTFGTDGGQMVTPEGEPIFHKYALSEGGADQTLVYMPKSEYDARLEVKPASEPVKAGKTKEVF